MADPKIGTGKKPKESDRRLYTDENPRDTVKIKFATPTDARKTVAKVKKILGLDRLDYRLRRLERVKYWKEKYEKTKS